MSEKNKSTDPEVTLLEHEYDGIQEYDQKLPNWWLFTLYITIIFSILYWFFYFQSNVGQTDEERLAQRLQNIEARNLEEALAMLDNENLWRMSQNPQFVESGARVYTSFCQACHGADLEGGIGLSLRDNDWVSVQDPIAMYNVVNDGIPNTGMTAFGSQLGPKRVAEVVAFVLSHHDEETTTFASEE